MATITARSVVDKARILIHDQTGVRWPDSELVGWLNDGQREIVILKPNACVKNESIQLVAGTKQSIPADGVQFAVLRRNMGADGNTPGRAITLVPRQILDEQTPDWHFISGSAEAIHYVFEDRDPKHFYVFPPQPAQPGYAEIIYSCAPTDIDAAQIDSGALISIDDIYAGALVDYLVYRAFTKDAEYAANDGRADKSYARFATAIGMKARNETGK